MIICMLLASVSFLFFIFLFMTANDNIVNIMTVCCKEIEEENIKKYQAEMKELAETVKKTGDITDKKQKKQAKDLKKKLSESRKKLERLEKGKAGTLELIPIAGYRMMQLLRWDGRNDMVKTLYNKCVQFKEKREAMNYTYYIIGALFGYVILGAVCFFLALGLLLAMGFGLKGVAIAAAIFLLLVMAGYLPYDNISVTVKDRMRQIENQFPQAISKMTLLTVAGMEVNQAWKLTSGSGKGVLYDEMKRVLVDLDNNVPPTDAYTKFITRCNNPYATKLATAIIQNSSKGNSEIVELFRRLNAESWMEHKHSAKRKGEEISSKLMVPTLLMFVGIIILVIVPVVTGFSF